jgi:predicted permease
LQQSLAEAAVLCVLGGGAAILVAVWGLALVRWLDPGVLSAPETAGVLGLSVPVLAFNWAVAILAALVFSMAPALAATRSDARTLMSGTRPRRGRVGPRGILVVAEVALATVLLVGAGLLLRSFDRLQATPIGFRPDNVFAAYVNVPTQAYSADEAASLLMEATRQIAARPGVEQAALANCLPANPSVGPLSGQCDQVGMRIRGAATDVEHDVWMNMVSAGYFSALGIPVLEGRAFDEGDSADAPRSAVVTESAASRYWPGRDPLGAYIQLSAGSDDWAEVVGVVGDAIGASRRELPEPGVYLSYPQLSYHSNYVVVRAATDPRPIASLVRSVLRELDPALPLWDVGTMEERLNRVTARDRFSTVLLGAFGVLALLLAAVGVYGVLAFLVAERIREVSIRLAIGATRRDVSTLVLRKGLYLTLLGLGIGIVAAAVVTRVLQTQLYAVSPLDPLTFVTAAIVLVAVAGVACYLPCRRAARVDPMATLRHE